MRVQMLIILAISLFSALVSAQELTDAEKDKILAPYFQSTLIFGHSVSGEFRKGPSYGKSPGRLLSEFYGGSKLTKIAENFGLDMETGFGKILRFVTEEEYEYPSIQAKLLSVKHYTAAELDTLFTEHSAIIGIDALYMSAMLNECGAYRNNEKYFTKILDAFIHLAFENKQIVVLGNVPKEKFELMNPEVKLFLSYAVKNPSTVEKCGEMLNRALVNTCKTELNCYIVDLAGMTAKLYNNETLYLDDWTPGNRVQMRPDGLNLSMTGTQYLSEQIRDALHRNMPVSEQDSTPK